MKKLSGQSWFLCVLLLSPALGYGDETALPTLLDPWVGISLWTAEGTTSKLRPTLAVQVGASIYFSHKTDSATPPCRGKGLYKIATASGSTSSPSANEPTELQAVTGDPAQAIASNDLCVANLSSVNGRLAVQYFHGGKFEFATVTETPSEAGAETQSSVAKLVSVSGEARARAAWQWKRALHADRLKLGIDNLEWYAIERHAVGLQGVVAQRSGSTIQWLETDLPLDFSATQIRQQAVDLVDVCHAGHASGSLFCVGKKGSAETNTILVRGPVGASAERPEKILGPSELGVRVLASQLTSQGLLVAVQGRAGQNAEDVTLGLVSSDGSVRWNQSIPPDLLRNTSGLAEAHGGVLITVSEPGRVFWVGRSEPFGEQELLPPSLEDISREEYQTLKRRLRKPQAAAQAPVEAGKGEPAKKEQAPKKDAP